MYDKSSQQPSVNQLGTQLGGMGFQPNNGYGQQGQQGQGYGQQGQGYGQPQMHGQMQGQMQGGYYPGYSGGYNPQMGGYGQGQMHGQGYNPGYMPQQQYQSPSHQHYGGNAGYNNMNNQFNLNLSNNQSKGNVNSTNNNQFGNVNNGNKNQSKFDVNKLFIVRTPSLEK